MNIDFTDPNIQALMRIIVEGVLALLGVAVGLAALKAREYMAREAKGVDLLSVKVRNEVIDQKVDEVVRYLEQTNKLNPQDGAVLKSIAMGLIPSLLMGLGIEIETDELDRKIEQRVQIMNQENPHLRFEEVTAITDVLK